MGKKEKAEEVNLRLVRQVSVKTGETCAMYVIRTDKAGGGRVVIDLMPPREKLLRDEAGVNKYSEVLLTDVLRRRESRKEGGWEDSEFTIH